MKCNLEQSWIYEERTIMSSNESPRNIDVIRCPCCNLLINMDFVKHIPMELFNYCFNCGEKLNYYKSYRTDEK